MLRRLLNSACCVEEQFMYVETKVKLPINTCSHSWETGWRATFFKLFRRQATAIFSENQTLIWRLIRAVFYFKHFTVFCQKNRLMHKTNNPLQKLQMVVEKQTQAICESRHLCTLKTQPKPHVCSSVFFQNLTDPGLNHLNSPAACGPVWVHLRYGSAGSRCLLRGSF